MPYGITGTESVLTVTSWHCIYMNTVLENLRITTIGVMSNDIKPDIVVIPDEADILFYVNLTLQF